MQISDVIGVLALIVFGLVVARGVQRRRDLLLAISDVIIAIGVVGETHANRLWNRRVQGLTYAERFRRPTGRVIKVLDWINEKLFDLGWRVEALALGEKHYNQWWKDENFGLSAASPAVNLAEMSDAEYDRYYGAYADDEDEYNEHDYLLDG